MTEAPVAPAEAAPEAAPVEVKDVAPVEPVESAPEEPVEQKTYTQEDLDRITAKVKKNERYRTKKEIEAYYQGRLESVQPKQEPQQPAADMPPSRDQFDNYEDFIEAKAEYTGRKAAREERQRYDQETKAQTQQRELAERFQSFQGKVAEKFPDLNERIEPIVHIPLPYGASEALAESEFGPDILNHFANDHKDFERFTALSPSAALREIGKLEARFESGAVKPAPSVTAVKKPSAAPTPIKPVGGNAVLGDGEPSHDNPEAWAAWRNRQILKRKSG